jgi:hypothetical protein
MDESAVSFHTPETKKQSKHGESLSVESFKTSWEGAVRTVQQDEFAVAFRRWMERCEKCVRIVGEYVEK